MLGLDMMLKSMGIDPEEVKKSVTEFGQVVLDIKAQLDRIEHKLDAAAVQRIAEENPSAENGELKNVE